MNHIEQELLHFLQSLGSAGFSDQLNATLQKECNSSDKAVELHRYYTSRPALTLFTINKELNRMDYVLVAGDSTITDQQEIARHLLENASSLAGRCANQTLWTDVVKTLMMNFDRLLFQQPQQQRHWEATFSASSCQFTIHLPAQAVQAEATFELSLPCETGRWKIAQVRLLILFCFADDRCPVFEAKVEGIRPVFRETPDWVDRVGAIASKLHAAERKEKERHLAALFQEFQQRHEEEQKQRQLIKQNKLRPARRRKSLQKPGQLQRSLALAVRHLQTTFAEPATKINSLLTLHPQAA